MVIVIILAILVYALASMWNPDTSTKQRFQEHHERLQALEKKK